MPSEMTTAEYNAELRKSQLEETFAGQLRMVFMDNDWSQAAIRREYQFNAERKWRADFAIDVLAARMPEHYAFHGNGADTLLIEIDGGTRNQGRHTRHEGYRGDCEKLNEAALHGYMVLRFTGDMVHGGEAIATVERAIKEWEDVT